MKKKTSLLLSGILVSGMILGTVITPNVVFASDNTPVTQADSAKTYRVGVKYYVKGTTNNVYGTPYEEKEVTGTAGTPITYVPAGYTLVGNQNPVITADSPNMILEIEKSATATVNFIDPNGNILSTRTVTGGEGEYYSLNNYLPDGYYWNNSSENYIYLSNSKEYNIPVSKSITNTIIFKDGNNEVGRTVVRADNVGDTVTLNGGQIPYGYTAETNTLTMQYSGNVQIVNVTKNADITPFKGVVTVNSNVYASYLYNSKGQEISDRVVGSNSAWKVFNKMTLNNKTYYQVATNEWIPAENVTVTSQESNYESIDGNTTVKPADTTVVTIKSLGTSGIALYKANGILIKDRKLGSNTAWSTDKMASINGVTMYRVATDEWVPAASVVTK